MSKTARSLRFQLLAQGPVDLLAQHITGASELIAKPADTAAHSSAPACVPDGKYKRPTVQPRLSSTTHTRSP
jgi:hypothetical protein